MDTQIFTGLFTVLMIGLFIGTNLGVLIMVLMRMAAPEDPEAEKPRADGSTRPG